MDAEKGSPSRESRELPVVCELSGAGLRERREELLRELFSGCEGTRELDDGYEFIFPGGENWAEKLFRFVVSERRCCRFFAFELLFETDGGPISLRMRGPEGTKEFIGAGLAGPDGE